MSYSNILELQFDFDETRASRHVDEENTEWTSAEPYNTPRHLKQGPAFDAALARLDEQFKAYSARVNGGR